MSAQTLFRRQSGDFLLSPEFLPGTGVPAPSAVSENFDDLTVASLNGRLYGGLNAFSGSGVFALQGATSTFTLPDTFNNTEWIVVVTMKQPYVDAGSTVAWAKASGPNTFDAASGCVSTDTTSYAFTYVAVGGVDAPPEEEVAVE